MTSQPQPLSGLGPNENAADNAAKPVPLDRSSAEWRSQFGVLPSPLQPSAATTAPPRSKNNNALSILAGIVGVIVVAGLIGYGYRPSQQDAATKNSRPKQAGAILASGSSVKKLRNKVNAVSPPAVAAAQTRVQAPEKSVPEKRAVKVAVKPAVKPAPRPRQAVKTPSPVRAVVAVAAPRPQQVPRKTPVVRKTPVPAVVAAAAAPRPERKPAVPAVPLAPVQAIKPREKLAPPPPTPKAVRPNSENLQSDGTNPLGLPQ